MKNGVVRIFAGVLIGLLALAGVVWVLVHSLGDRPPLYDGRTLDAWKLQLDSHEPGASNQAYAVLSGLAVTTLVDQMFHDTNDSQFKISVVGLLNGIPGVQISCAKSDLRRADAARALATIGPPAQRAVPSLIQVLKDPEIEWRECAIQALGSIHAEPEVVIPLLVSYLTNESLNDQAAEALGNFGSRAKEAFPKIVPLLHSKEKEARHAAHIALKQIDPVAAAEAMGK